MSIISKNSIPPCSPDLETIRLYSPNSSRVKIPSRRAFSSTPSFSAAKKLSRFDYRDAYAYHHAKRRREANISRQAVLQQQRAEALGDPIRGVPTAFVQSFDAPTPQPIEIDISTDIQKPDERALNQISPSTAKAETEERLGHFVTKTELQQSLEYSRQLTEPIRSFERSTADPAQEASDAQLHKLKHEIASEAMSRILNPDNASGMQRTRTNIQLIIDTFGRHKTDQYMKLKAPSSLAMNKSIPHLEPTPRAGPDVGSSEVQIGILTAKIRVLADRYESDGRKDKLNKRNLRVLLHRRQKLLKYMLRKERGSPRWHHMIEKLGLTEATWMGQIEVR